MRNYFLCGICSAFILIFVGTNSYSQKMFVNFGLGYNFNSAATYMMTDNIDVYTQSGGNIYYTGVNNTLKETVSFGKGTQYGGSIGYFFTKNFSFEVGIHYLKGNEYEDKFTEKSSYVRNVYIRKYNSHLMRISPGIRLSVGNKIKPYLKAGLVIGVNPKMEIEENFDFVSMDNTRNHLDAECEMTKGSTLGFTAGIGLSLEMDKRFGFFAEINMISQSWAPEKLSYTKYNLNGVDILSDVPTNVKEKIFVDSYTESYDSNTSYPSQGLINYLPLSSIGFNAGVFYKLF